MYTRITHFNGNLHRKHTSTGQKNKVVRLLCKTHGETDLYLHILLAVRKSSCRTWNR